MIFSALRVAFVGEIENNFAGEQELYLGKISIFGQEKYGLCWFLKISLESDSRTSFRTVKFKVLNAEAIRSVKLIIFNSWEQCSFEDNVVICSSSLVA